MTLQPLSWAYIYREKHGLKRCMHPNVDCSTVYNSQGMESVSVNPLTEDWIKKMW